MSEAEDLGGKKTEGAKPGAKAQPSGPKGDNPATAGPGETNVKSETPENREGQMNPSAPGETGTTTKVRP